MRMHRTNFSCDKNVRMPTKISVWRRANAEDVEELERCELAQEKLLGKRAQSRKKWRLQKCADEPKKYGAVRKTWVIPEKGL